MSEERPRSEMHRRQKAKNVALMLALLAFVVIVFLVTVVRLGGG